MQFVNCTVDAIGLQLTQIAKWSQLDKANNYILLFRGKENVKQGKNLNLNKEFAGLYGYKTDDSSNDSSQHTGDWYIDETNHFEFQTAWNISFFYFVSWHLIVPFMSAYKNTIFPNSGFLWTGNSDQSKGALISYI